MLEELKLYSAKYNDEEFTAENHLSNAFLTKSEFLSPIVTFLYGGGSKEFSSYNFPLLFMTEGLGRIAKNVSIDSTDLSYKIAVLGAPKETSTIARTIYSSGDKPGLGFSFFTVPFKDRHFYKGQSVYTPSGLECRIYKNPEQQGNEWLYTLQILTGNSQKYVPLSDLSAGMKWGAGAVKVSKSHSRGTETRSYTPYAGQNQISVVRQSYPIAGNMANKVMVMEIRVDGQTFRLWTQWELFLTRKRFMSALESDLLYSTYNKDTQGVIHQTDEDSGGVVTSGAGALQQIFNTITYSKMSGRLLRTIMNDLLFHANGTDPVNLVFLTGTGGMDEVSEALKDDVLTSYTLIASNDVMKKGSDGYYSAGGPYFNKLIHREGHSITFQYHPAMDRGPRAKAAPKHPVTGWSLEGYNMYAVDMSVVEGEPNVQYVSEKGRESIEKIVQGMAKVPVGTGDSMFASSDIDVSSIEWIKTQGIAIRRLTNCAKILCDIS